MSQDKNFLTPMLPLAQSGELDYRHVDEYSDLIRQNFKNLILTIPGERVMDTDFGVGIQRFLFESSLATSASSIQSAVAKKTQKYMPFVNLQNVIVEPGEIQDSMTVRIFYSVPSLAINEYINLTFNSDGTLRS
jgi:phage baseplate assembly protein W